MRYKSVLVRSVRTSRVSRTSRDLSAGARFYPSGCGGHKNSENVATFSEFLGGRKNLDLARTPERFYGPNRTGTAI